MLKNPLSRIIAGLLATSLVAVTLAAWMSPIELDFNAVQAAVTAVAVVALVATGMALVNYRLAGDETRIARSICYVATATFNVMMAAGTLVVMSSSMVALNYLALSTALPLHDETFAAIDAAMGFDWLATLAWTNDHPRVAQTLTFAYHSSIGQLGALIIVLGVTHQAQQLREFFSLYALCAVAVLILSALLPAMGAYVHHNPAPALFTNMGPDAGLWHLQHLQGLRDGSFKVLNIMKPEGLVTFPSFHTIVAIVTTYAFRKTRFLALPILGLNVLVILSTVPEGGHYLIDVIAGAMIALAAIAVVRYISAPTGAAPRILPTLPGWLWPTRPAHEA